MYVARDEWGRRLPKEERRIQRLGPNLFFWRLCMRDAHRTEEVADWVPGSGPKFLRKTHPGDYVRMLGRYLDSYPYLRGWI